MSVQDATRQGLRLRLRKVLSRVPFGAGVTPEEQVSLAFLRTMMLIGGAVYLAWWVVVEALLTGAFNPLPSRLAVVGLFWALAGLTFLSPWAARSAQAFLSIAISVLVLHYFYLLYGNGGSRDWVVGTYFTVVATNAIIQRRSALLFHNALVLGLGVLSVIELPHLRGSLFMSGLVTIGVLAYIGLHNRLALVGRLARSTERFQRLFHSTFEGIVVHDAGLILEANASAGQLFGVPAEVLVGTEVSARWSEESRLAVGPATAWEGKGHFDVVARRANGARLDLEVSAKEYRSGGRRLGLVSFRDVSDRRRAEEERARFIQAQAGREAAEDAVRRREEFISIAAHELRTPLTSLQLHVQRLAQRMDALEAPAISKDELSPRLASCERQVRRLTRLTRDLLELSRQEMESLRLEPEWIELKEVVDSVVDGFSEEIERAGSRVHTSFHGDLRLRADRIRLEQVISNLLRNALLYGDGKPIAIVGSEGPQGVLFRVEDQGIGIDPEHQKRVFERFERAVSAVHYGGLGLGLYIAKQIVLAHGGSIRVVSAPGVGSAFTVELPRDSLAQGVPAPRQ